MRITKKYLSMARTVTILTLLLIATPSINSADSSLQQEVSIQNTVEILFSQDNFTETIFFEYGAESGELQPPWDVAGFHYGYDPDAYVEVVPSSPLGHTVQVRSGSKSVEIYKPATTPIEVYSQGFQKHSTAKEVYLSRWVYFPNIPAWNVTAKTYKRFSFGGFVMQFGPSDFKSKYFFGLNLAQRQYSSSTFTAEIRWWGLDPDDPDDHYVDPSEDFTEFYNTGLYIADYVGVWTHIQMGLKLTTDNTGWGRIWLNREGEPSTLIYEKMGIKTDPEGYSQWSTKGGYYLTGFDTPSAYFGLHKSIDMPEAWIFIDDVVLATSKVPETYGVFDDAY